MRAHSFRAVAGAVAVGVALLGAGCGRSSEDAGGTTAGVSRSAPLSATTPAGSAEVDSATWAMYRDTITVDPIFAGDYPERQVVALMCESLLRQQPDGTTAPGLARLSYRDPRTVVLTLADGVRFWDGSPLTPADVVYSIDRNRDPRVGGYWASNFGSVDTVTVTGEHEVTLKLRRPDYWLEGVLSFMAGVVVKKSYAQERGKDYGTPSGGAMCTGSYRLGAWRTGGAVQLVRNDDYWNSGVRPHVRELSFKGVPDHSALTAGLLTGEIDGTYPLGLSTLDQLRQSDAVEVYEGPSYMVGAMILNLDGPLGDVRVRQALSLALDRQGIVATTFKGTAEPSRALASPGTWGYAKDVFSAAWDALPAPEPDLDAARRLVEEAGASGREITIATSSELQNIDTDANAYRTAAEAIGLRVKLKSSPAAVYSNLFVDADARKQVDAFATMNYANWGDPASLYAPLTFADGSQNYYGYRSSAASAKLEQARATADPQERARLVTEAQQTITEELPWIATVSPHTVLVMSSKLTGAPASSVYLSSPWADTLGGRG
ncbi:ABC transporter substrate-binding protein [Conexibacter woesei]|uniref:Extracellular solute-binding protein family 5 n=1 Tax=Conexibacter woesei (strain DSM 14684 / CCUG 47730 / CIP 108061 / JCM 11494 / NBRC 100937 / ID131577) TaxID=469383 RepID=D3F5J4_CONWI|nr:ABC transporter substrate-binding protein [Conexibacter woesei]ADB50661.1 extracellular solute-binding protein family 5 [Conexibacter woesei DSM 14684]